MWHRRSIIVVIAVGVIQFAACASGEPEKGRFVALQSPSPAEAPPPVVHATVAPSSSPTPSPTPELDEPPESAKLYLQMSDEEQYEFVERRARHISRMIGS